MLNGDNVRTTSGSRAGPVRQQGASMLDNENNTSSAASRPSQSHPPASLRPGSSRFRRSMLTNDIFAGLNPNRAHDRRVRDLLASYLARMDNPIDPNRASGCAHRGRVQGSARAGGADGRRP